MTVREKRIAALRAKQEAERGRERDPLALPVMPAGAVIPTKPAREGLQPEAVVEDEFFGGFRKTDKIDEVIEPGVWRKSGKGGWRQVVEPSPWVRRWGLLADVDVTRFGRRIPWLRAPRRWAAEPPSNGPWPFVVNYERHHDAELRGGDAGRQQQFERAINFDAERDRAERVEAAERHEASLDEPYGGDKHRFARGIRHLEYRTMLAEHTERRIQAMVCRHYKPSRKLEAKRFPTLPKLEQKLFPKEPPGRMFGFGSVLEFREAMRAALVPDTAEFYEQGFKTAQCPPEMTTRMLEARQRPRKKPGRKTLFGPPMDRSQIQKRYRMNKKLRDNLRVITEAPPLSPGETHEPVTSRGQRHVGGLDRGGDGRANKETTD